jgi:hypothetical protein
MPRKTLIAVVLLIPFMRRRRLRRLAQAMAEAFS